jgi:nitrite reductase/ring-hydroxylating ferredoxin subunit
MTVEHRVGPLSAIPCGEGRMIQVGPQLISVFHLRGGVVRATQPWCPHRGGPLADGLVDGEYVVCPLHNRAYCFETGEALGATERLVTFSARVEGDGTVVVALPETGQPVIAPAGGRFTTRAAGSPARTTGS